MALTSRSSAPEMDEPAKESLHIDIWDAVFEQLCIHGFHKTLANCALLSKGHTWLALRRLYGCENMPGHLGRTPPTLTSALAPWMIRNRRESLPLSTLGFWEAVIFSTRLLPGRCNAGPLTSHPYLTYVRHLDTLNLHSVLSLMGFRNQRSLAIRLNLADSLARRNPRGSVHNPYSTWMGQHYRSRDLVCLRLLQALIRLADDRALRLMLKGLTAGKWSKLFPTILDCHELERLSLLCIGDIGPEAADLVSQHLPKLKHLTFLEADDRQTLNLASFISRLRPDQLHIFQCSLVDTQLPVICAIVKQTGLRQLRLRFMSAAALPLEPKLPTQLTNLTSLELSFDFYSDGRSLSLIKKWAERYRGAVTDWLVSCANLRSLHIFRIPDLMPAVTDALRFLRLDRLHIFGTGCYGPLYGALHTQRLRYLFLAECSGEHIITIGPAPGLRERSRLVVNAVRAMPSLRDLRLHTYFPLGHRQLQEVAVSAPDLETLSFVQDLQDDTATILRALERFERLTSLMVLGLTTFAARDVLAWIERTGCHLRPGGFSLSLPAQNGVSWLAGGGAELPDGPEGRELETWIHAARDDVDDAATQRIRELLRVFGVWVRGRSGEGQTWRGNDYGFYEELAFVSLWGDVFDAADRALVVAVAKDRGIYPPYVGETARLGVRVA